MTEVGRGVNPNDCFALLNANALLLMLHYILEVLPNYISL